MGGRSPLKRPFLVTKRPVEAFLGIVIRGGGGKGSFKGLKDLFFYLFKGFLSFVKALFKGFLLFVKAILRDSYIWYGICLRDSYPFKQGLF